MARSSDYYILYQTWAKVRRGQLIEDIDNQRLAGWPDKTEKELYGKVAELSLYIWALESYHVSNFTSLEADVIIDRIVEITETSSGIRLSAYPCVKTYNVDVSGSVNNALFTLTNRFTALTDTFASYAGKANQFVKVNGGETGLTTGSIAGADISYTPGAAGTTLTATTVKEGLDQIDAHVITNTAGIATNDAFRTDVDSTGTGIVVKFTNSPTTPRYIKRTITASTNISITNGDGVSGNPTIATSLTPSFTTVTATGNVTVGGNIVVTGLVDGVDISIADGLNLKRAGGQNSMLQDINMNALYRVMNAPTAVANGQVTTYEQVVRTTGDQAGLTGVKEWSNQSVFAGAIIKDNVPLAATLTVDPDEQLIVGSGYDVNGTLDVHGDFFVV